MNYKKHAIAIIEICQLKVRNIKRNRRGIWVDVMPIKYAFPCVDDLEKDMKTATYRFKNWKQAYWTFNGYRDAQRRYTE